MGLFSFKQVPIFRKVSCIIEKVSSAASKVSSTAQKVSSTFEKYIPLLQKENITDRYIESIEKVFRECGTDTPFGQMNVQEWLKCSKSKATNVMKAMKKAKVIRRAAGAGFGRYFFIEL